PDSDAARAGATDAVPAVAEAIHTGATGAVTQDADTSASLALDPDARPQATGAVIGVAKDRDAALVVAPIRAKNAIARGVVGAAVDPDAVGAGAGDGVAVGAGSLHTHPVDTGAQDPGSGAALTFYPDRGAQTQSAIVGMAKDCRSQG